MGYQNYFATKLYNDIGAADTTITLETPPTETSGRLALEARNATQREIIKYTNVSGNQITGVTRGQGGTTAKSHLKNSLVEMNVTAEDFADLYTAFASFSASNNDWRTLLATVTGVTYNGNRSYDLAVNTDITAIVSPGMRLRTTRTVAAPTQCTSLNGTNQYWSDSSVSGISFTDDFCAGAWVKLSSYGASGIISRYNGTSGWSLLLQSDGTVELVGYNAGAGNSRRVSSYQSLPLNRWVHVAAQLDMSAYTATNTTCYIMIDGVDVPAKLTTAGTNPVALVQAGNLEVGSYNGTGFLPGKVAQSFVSSAKITQANMRAIQTQGLTPALISSNNIASAYSFSNSSNDLNTTNANNLSANGSAVATNADSPFGTQGDGTISSTLDYAILAKATSTTLTVNVPEGCTIPTSGGVSALAYSSVKIPHQFPAQVSKWRVNSLTIAGEAVSIGSLNIFFSATGGKLNVPVGEWRIGYSGNIAFSSSVNGSRSGWFTVAQSTPLFNIYGYPAGLTTRVLNFATTAAHSPGQTSTPISQTTMGVWNSYGGVDAASGTEVWQIAFQQQYDFFVDNAYL